MTTNDTNQLKKLLSETKPNDMRVLFVNSLDRNSYRNYAKHIDGFMKFGQDYVITVIKK